MKAVTLQPYECADEKLLKKGPVAAYSVNYKRTDNPPWRERTPQQIRLVKVGHRVHFSEEWDTDATLLANANIALGIKTAARAFQDAIDGKVVRLKVTSFGETSGSSFALQRSGNRIAFVAPCGAQGYLTVSEAEKVVAALRSL